MTKELDSANCPYMDSFLSYVLCPLSCVSPAPPLPHPQVGSLLWLVPRNTMRSSLLKEHGGRQLTVEGSFWSQRKVCVSVCLCVHVCVSRLYESPHTLLPHKDSTTASSSSWTSTASIRPSFRSTTLTSLLSHSGSWLYRTPIGSWIHREKLWSLAFCPPKSGSLCNVGVR